jgi:SAM-dependent methyltransferase
MTRSLFLKIYPALLKRRATLIKLGTPILKLRALWYRGHNVHCPCCEGQFRKFLAFGANSRPDALCPGCLSLERHRLLWLFLTNKTNLFSDALKVLHIAPEFVFKKYFVSMPNLQYLSADLEPDEVMVQMDITKIQYPNASFDVILCNHVLEHVPTDQVAMEELFRVLKPGGWAILQVPLDSTLEHTLEGTPDLTPEMREKQFGHHDHVRLYGQDYKTKLEAAGFTVTVDRYTQDLGLENIRRFGLTADEAIYWCTKPAGVLSVGRL